MISGKRLVKIGLVQMSMVNDMELNLTKAINGIEKLAEMGAEIVALPELFRTPYFCNQETCNYDYEEAISGDTINTLALLAKNLGIVLVAGSIYEKGGYNTSVVIDTTGEILGNYRKSHIPNDEGFFEKNYFTEGNTGVKVFNTTKGKISVLICFDQWFPEVARIAALKGAEIIFYPTAIGNVNQMIQTDGNWLEAWETVQRGHAIANSVVVAVINRVGTEGDSIFWGSSFICDAFGKVLTRGGVAEELILSEVDLNHGNIVGDSWGFFRCRRPETYKDISKI
jgi:agmatine deiminase